MPCMLMPGPLATSTTLEQSNYTSSLCNQSPPPVLALTNLGLMKYPVQMSRIHFLQHAVHWFQSKTHKCESEWLLMFSKTISSHASAYPGLFDESRKRETVRAKWERKALVSEAVGLATKWPCSECKGECSVSREIERIITKRDESFFKHIIC